jgi:hypothetical protein
MRTASRNLALFAALAVSACAAWPAVAATPTVPFVGCAGDGQTGPVAAPKGAAKAVAIDAAAASQLAYYATDQDLGALAPKGWKCFFVYGSSGATLAIAATDPSKALTNGTPLSGDAVVLTYQDGGTSGRFDVARYAARLFPQLYQAFIAGVIAEGIEPKESFPSGPYPADKLIYKTQRLVEFVTPANSDGLGDSGLLKKNASPISGMAKIVDSPDGPQFYLLTVRLPANQAALAPAIVAAGE